ncbi:MAG: hypothetical protein AB3N06_10110 [Erythrobacter sp.]
MLRPTVVLAAGAALLAACGGDTPAEESAVEAERGAKGDVVGGTISDDMLPLDRLRSRSPALREEPATPPADSPADEQVSPEPEPQGVSAPDAQGEGGEPPVED